LGFDHYPQHKLHQLQAQLGLAVQKAVVTHAAQSWGQDVRSMRHKKSLIGSWRYAGFLVLASI
jgi:hypothetical protein